MHHGQFEVGRGIVDRNAPVLGERHDDERDQRHAERDAQADVARNHISRDGRQLGRARDQREREDDDDHRRLGQRAEQGLAARPEAAEARADVEPGEREEEPRRAQERDDGDEIGRPREQKPGREGRNQRGGDPGRGEHEIGHEAEEPRGAVGDDRLLAGEADEIAIRLQERRPASARQARLGHAHEAGQQRRDRDDQRHLQQLEDEIDDQGHDASTTRSATSAPKTTLRYWRMVRNCRRLSRSRRAFDACDQRRVERVPDPVAQRQVETRRPCLAGRRHDRYARARRRRRRRTRGGSAARSSPPNIASAGDGSGKPQSHAGARRKRGGGEAMDDARGQRRPRWR